MKKVMVQAAVAPALKLRLEREAARQQRSVSDLSRIYLTKSLMELPAEPEEAPRLTESQFLIEMAKIGLEPEAAKRIHDFSVTAITNNESLRMEMFDD